MTPDAVYALEERIQAIIDQLAEEILKLADTTDVPTGVAIGFYAAGRQLETTQTMLQFLRRHLEKMRVE